MATTSTSTAVAAIEPVFTEPERLALAGFLAGYTGLTREAYALDLRQYASWCQQHQVRLFQARRADIECFARDWKPAAAPGLPSLAACAPSPGSTGTPSRRNFSIFHPLHMCVGRGWTTSPMPRGWIATSSAQFWLPQAWASLPSMH